DPRIDADAIRAWCAARLAAFKVPERVVFVENLPRTSVGKIQKNVVRDDLTSITPSPIREGE
ncbi:MAG TPA: hypothetical protein VFZ25_04490, partial [Chloroflexota bacterium]|nr:hypothetical protein [Chloroflexota bacterium]